MIAKISVIGFGILATVTLLMTSPARAGDLSERGATMELAQAGSDNLAVWNPWIDGAKPKVGKVSGFKVIIEEEDSE